jgi:hypothetical protein
MVIPLEIHLQKAGRELASTIESVLALVQPGEATVVAVKHAILVSARSTFLALKIRKTYLEVEFILDREVEGFPVYRTFRISKNKVVHFVRIGAPDDLDAPLRNMILESFTLNKYPV